MRIFIAIDFNKETKAYLESILRQVKERATKGRFTDTANFHMTLKFIGEMTIDQIEPLYGGLIEGLKDVKPFAIQMDRMFSFERQGTLMPLVGVSENGYLLNLFRLVDEIVSSQLKIQKERQIKPHITIGRQVILKNKGPMDIEVGRDVMVNQIAIMESKQVGGKLVYTPLKVIPLLP